MTGYAEDITIKQWDRGFIVCVIDDPYILREPRRFRDTVPQAGETAICIAKRVIHSLIDRHFWNASRLGEKTFCAVIKARRVFSSNLVGRETLRTSPTTGDINPPE